MWSDAHVHLNDPGRTNAFAALGDDADTDAKRLDADCTCREVLVGTCPADWQEVIAAAAGREHVTAAIGIHPWFVMGFEEKWLVELERLLDAHEHVQVGEIGLDAAWMPRGEEHAAASKADVAALQQAVFRRQMVIAAKKRRTVSVHCVRAHAALLQVLKTLDEGFPTKVYLHSCIGNPESTRQLVKLDIERRGSALLFGVSLQVNARGLFQYKQAKALPGPYWFPVSTDTGTEGVSQVGVTVGVTVPLEWEHAESGARSSCPWRTGSGPGWLKFVQRLGEMPPGTMLLESDMSGRATAAERKWRLAATAAMCADALGLTPQAVLQLAWTNIQHFMAPSPTEGTSDAC